MESPAAENSLKSQILRGASRIAGRGGVVDIATSLPQGSGTHRTAISLYPVGMPPQPPETNLPPAETVTPPRPMKPISWWAGVAAALFIFGAIAGSYLWLSDPLPDTMPKSTVSESTSDPALDPASAELELARLQAEARRNALATGAGFAALGALLLAFHRQRHVEHQQRFHEFESQRAYKQREGANEDSRDDALQRRITDARIRAVEQLGSENPAVRIGGLHNLERIGGQHEFLRQIVLDEICSYLRLPFTPAAPSVSQPLTQYQFEPLGPLSAETNSGESEREVRLIAQEILQRHLNSEYDHDNYWIHTRLNLKNAFLDNISLRNCELVCVDFTEARFSGTADFAGATFRGPTRFNKTTFKEESNFDRSKFKGLTNFNEAIFDRAVEFNAVAFDEKSSFSRATFNNKASFKEATFARQANFEKTVFASSTSLIEFSKANFNEGADFEGANFGHFVDFKDTTFGGFTVYSGCVFRDRANFKKAMFEDRANFRGATFKGWIDFEGARFIGWIDFERVIFGGIAGFEKVVFKDDAGFAEATFKSSAVFDAARIHKALVAINTNLVSLAEGQGLLLNLKGDHRLPEGWRVEPSSTETGWGFLNQCDPVDPMLETTP